MSRFSNEFAVYLHFYCLLIIAFFAIACSQTAKAQEDEESLKHRFLREAPPQWEKFFRRAKELQGKIVMHIKVDYRNNTLLLDREYKGNNRGKIVKFTDHSKNDEEKTDYENIYGANPKYAFKLERKTHNLPWLLVGLADLGQETDGLSNVKRQYDFFLSEITLPVKLQHELLSDAVRQPTFRIIRVRSVQQKGEELVEVQFEYLHEEEKGNYERIQLGTLLLDPNRLWTWRSSDLKVKHGTIKNRAVLRDDLDSFPIPQELIGEEERTVDPQAIARGFPAKIRKAWRTEFILEFPQHLPDDKEFTLSAFGLPEPSLAKQPFPWYLAVAAIGAFSLGIFFFLRVRASRVRATG